MSAGPRAIETWERLLVEGGPLLDALGDGDVDLGVVARLRQRWDADLVAAGIELARARRKAARKFPDSGRLVADVAGVEVASSHDVARHKAARFATLGGGGRVADLCCGIGGDAIALAEVAHVVGVDRDALRSWMTGRNAGCATVTADVTDLAAGTATDTVTSGIAGFHLDPSRRAGGGRRRRYADYEPGPAFVEAMLDRCAHGAIKLGPGVAFEDLPLDGAREIELIAERGTLVQAVLWCGRLATRAGERTATRLPDGTSVSGRPGPLPVGEDDAVDAYVALLDPALERAQIGADLCAEHGLREIHPGLGVLTSARPPESPWFASYAVDAILPWRPKRVKAWLADHGGGIVTVKTRGRAITDTDAAQKTLRGRGDQPYTVFGLRLGEKIVAIVTRPS